MAQDPVYNERLRLCRELHDGAVQDIIGALLMLRAMSAGEPETALPHREAAIRAVERALAGARKLIREARSANDSRSTRRAWSEPMAAVIGRFVAPVVRCGGLRLQVDVAPGIAVHSAHVEEVGNILREAARNVVRHAAARTLQVTAARAARSIAIELRDDGVGFRTLDIPDRFGIAGMAERAALLGGSVLVTSCAGVGTLVRVTVPFAHPSSAGGVSSAAERTDHASGLPPSTRLVA